MFCVRRGGIVCMNDQSTITYVFKVRTHACLTEEYNYILWHTS